jgi:hypothetical protein
MRVKTPPYFLDIFDTWEEARRFQRISIYQLLAEGYAIREAGIDIEKNFDTKKTTYRAYARPYIIVTKDEP